LLTNLAFFPVNLVLGITYQNEHLSQLEHKFKAKDSLFFQFRADQFPDHKIAFMEFTTFA